MEECAGIDMLTSTESSPSLEVDTERSSKDEGGNGKYAQIMHVSILCKPCPGFFIL
jgi:hypothetical protein